MQNKPKLRKSQINVNMVLIKDYEKRTLSERGKNKPKTNPNKAKQTQTNPISTAAPARQPDQAQILEFCSPKKWFDKFVWFAKIPVCL